MRKALLALTLFLALCGNAEAATKTWQNGGVNNNYSTAGNWAEGSKPAAGDDVVIAANYAMTMDESTANLKSWDMTGYANTVSGSGNITVVGATSSTNVVIFAGTMTISGSFFISPTTASAVINFTSNGVGVTNLQLTPSGSSSSIVFQDNYTGRALKTCQLIIVSSVGTTNINGKTIAGNSSTDRLLIRATTLGTAQTITNTTGTFANADFRDITFSDSADYSAITGLSGDCGGNTNATFTTAATQTYTGGTGSWSDVTKWTSRVPLPQDNVLMSGVTGGTITADMPRLGKSIDWTGASGSPTWSANTVAYTLYGSITLISGMTYTKGGTGTMTFEGRGSFTLDSAGKTFPNTNISAVGGTVTLASAFNTDGTFTATNGTFADAGFSFTSSSTFNSNNVNVRSITKSGTWTFSNSSGTSWLTSTTTNLTFSDTGTILISDTGASSKTFSGGGLTYNNLLISGGGAGAVIITGANTFNRIYTNGGGTKSITLPGSTTTTIISNQGLGNLTNLITFTASAGSATIANAQGNLSWDYVSLTNIIGSTSGNGKFYAGPTTHSTDGGGNTNWIFDLAPAGGSGAGRQGRFIGYPGVYRR